MPTVQAPAPINFAAESISLLIADVWILRVSELENNCKDRTNKNCFLNCYNAQIVINVYIHTVYKRYNYFIRFSLHEETKNFV